MSLALPSALVSAAPSRASSSSAARLNEQESNDLPSFGEVLSRSLTPTAEPAEPARAKPAAAAAKRQPTQQPADPQDLVNALALALVAPESKVLPALPTSAAAAGSALVGATAGTGGAASSPGMAATALAGLVADTAASAAGSTPAQDLRSAAIAADAATDTAAELARAAAPAPTAAHALAAANIRDTRDAAPPTPAGKSGAAGQDLALALVPGSIAAPTPGTDTATSDPSAQRDPGQNQATHREGKLTAEGLGATPANPRGLPARAAGEPPTTSPDTAALPASAATVSASAPLPASADPLGAGAAMTLPPATAAAPGATGAATPAAIATPLLIPEVGDGQWAKALGQQLVHMGKAGQQVAELQLNPPGLGPLKVTLSMDEHRVQAMFVSTHSSVRAAVEAALPQLRATLADSGINLGNTSVSDYSQQQSAFAQRQDEQPEQRNYRGERQPVDSTGPVARADERPARPEQGLTVDTYA